MSGLIFPAIMILVVLVLVVAIAVFRGRLTGATPEEPAYEACKELFTPAERSFFGVLEQAVAGEFKVFGKVRLGDLVQPAKRLSPRTKTVIWNRIQRKHVDFVLCQPDTLAVIAAVELDDASHNRKDRAERDDLVDKALASAGVPVLHFPARKAYAVAEVRAKIAERLSLKVIESEPSKKQVVVKAAEDDVPKIPAAQVQASVAAVPAVVETAVAEQPDTPVCPACDLPMVKRQARNGPHAGKWFWACSGYPKCRKIVSVG